MKKIIMFRGIEFYLAFGFLLVVLVGLYYYLRPGLNSGLVTQTPVYDYGLSGEVQVSEEDLQGKVYSEFTEEQQAAYRQAYGLEQVDGVVRVTGVVENVDSVTRSVRVSYTGGSGWVKLSELWRGNVLEYNEDVGSYAEVEQLYIGESSLEEVFGYFNGSSKVQLFCTDVYFT